MRLALVFLAACATDPNPFEPVACMITDHVTTCDAACLPETHYEQAGGACTADHYECSATVTWNGYRGCCDYDANLDILWHACEP